MTRQVNKTIYYHDRKVLLKFFFADERNIWAMETNCVGCRDEYFQDHRDTLLLRLCSKLGTLHLANDWPSYVSLRFGEWS